MKFLKRLFQIAVYIWASITFFIFLSFVGLYILGFVGPKDECFDDGGVWDNEHEVCRFDCTGWDKETGCIMESDESLEEYVNGYCSGDGKGLYRCNAAAAELSKRRQWMKMKGIE